MLPRLSPRLRAVAEAVRPGEPMADVGTDHGLLPVRLLLDGRVPRAFALDLRPAPLARAVAAATRLGLGEREGFVARRSDGLLALAPGEAHTAVFAGLGGALVVGALARSPALTRPGAPGALGRLVIQPNLEPERVRAWAQTAGWDLVEEEVIEDGPRLFTLLVLEPAARPPRWSEADLLFGPLLRARRPPRWLEQLRRARERLLQARQTALPGASEAAIRALDERIAALDRELAGPTRPR